MKQVFVLGVALLALAATGCATKGYVRKQNAKVSERLNQVQTNAIAFAGKQNADALAINAKLNAIDEKSHEAMVNAAETDTYAARADASAARAEVGAARADAAAARAEVATARADATAARAEVTTAKAEAAAAQERAELAQSEADRAKQRPNHLPKTASQLPLIALSGFVSLFAAGALRLFRR